MSAKILTPEILAAEKVENGLTRESKVFMGYGREAVQNTNPKVYPVALNGVEGDAIPYKVTSKAWKNSSGRFQLMKDLHACQDRIQNAAGGPSATDLATYFSLLFIDVNRMADELADYSGSIYNVIAREDAQEISYLRDLIPYVGKEKVISSQNDGVPLIEDNLANSAAITLYFKAFGWKSSMKNMVFNPTNVLERVTEAAATINVDSRNKDIIGYLVGLTYPAKQAQAADTGGSTYDLKMYNTFMNALKTLAALKHPLTGKLLAEMGAFSGGVKILCHPADAWAIQRCVSGQLASAGGVLQIATALPFAEIIPYGGGIMNGLTWGKETLSLPGVTQGYAYVFLPNQLGGFVLDKRTQTLEVGTGSVLELSAEERAWYRINGLYHDWFVGGAKDNTNSGLGCIVKVTLPS